MKPYTLLFILSLLMNQCGPPPSDSSSGSFSTDKPLIVDGKSTGMYRFYDPEYGVACYQRASHLPLSCVKVK